MKVFGYPVDDLCEHDMVECYKGKCRALEELNKAQAYFKRAEQHGPIDGKGL